MFGKDRIADKVVSQVAMGTPRTDELRRIAQPESEESMNIGVLRTSPDQTLSVHALPPDQKSLL